ncbi:MAG: tRNA (adenosine(37)-N6)-threonylcarbamoyltransferase complex transferase subunit TsaD [Planctomycetaceae bacterium]
MASPRADVLLAIESSCDETAAAVVDRDLTVRSSVISSQSQLHERFGGVVPEIASRAHVERILPVIDEALRTAHVGLHEISAIAVATQPGLVGSLLVGLTAAKTLAMTLDLPLIPVNHVEGHIYACRMSAGPDVFPAIGLVISGGHTNLYYCSTPLDFQPLGSTIDDAPGEAFHKVANLLGLAYPGGPSIEAAAQQGNPRAFAFPRAFLHDPRIAFSFSGLKTAVLYEIRGTPGSHRPVPALNPSRIADVAASFQEAVVDVVVAKCGLAMKQQGIHSLCVGGGVAANGRLRERLRDLDGQLVIAPPELCTDNAAMGSIAWELLDAGRTANLDVDVVPGLLRQT